MENGPIQIFRRISFGARSTCFYLSQFFGIPFALAQRGLGKRALAPKGTCPTPSNHFPSMWQLPILD
jgi:hypothetical protein